MLFSAVVAAEAVGTVTFQADSADLLPAHDVTVYGSDSAIPVNRIDYGSLTLSVLDGDPPFITSGGCGTLHVTTDPGTIWEAGNPGSSSVRVSADGGSCDVSITINGETSAYRVEDTGLTLDAADPTAKERGQETGQYWIAPEDPAQLLCTSFRLIVDATDAQLDPELATNNLAVPGADYHLEYPLDTELPLSALPLGPCGVEL